MSTNRALLDFLGRSALVRLMRERNLTPTRENEERRKSLAHSYRGDVEALILDLTRQELVELFKVCSFGYKGVESCVANPAKYRLEELQAFAIRAFAERRVRIPAEFTPVDDKSDDEGEDASDDDDGDDPGDDAETAEEPSVAEALGIETASWSRPRMVGRIFETLGHEPLQRLRTARFQELISMLAAAGLEACLADDPSETVLTPEAMSPGIEAKLRMRLGRTATRTRANVVQNDRDVRIRDGGPPIVVHAGEKPVPVQVARPSDYNLAVLRLQFLTAVPSVERQTLKAWPDGYLSAATKGLSVRTQELALLRAYSAGLCIGNHNPYDAIPRLSQVLSATEWETLLADFQALNPFQPELVQAIVEQVEPVVAPRSSTGQWRAAQPQPADFGAPTGTESPPEPRAAASTRPTPANLNDEHRATNQRDLGALDGMFDED